MNVCFRFLIKLKSIPKKPQANKATISFTPNKQAISVKTPKTPISKFFNAFFPKFIIAIAIIAITAGFIPYIKGSTAGNCPYFS